MTIIKTKKNQNKDDSTSGRKNIRYVILATIISISVLTGMIFLNNYMISQELHWSHRDLSTGNSQSTIEHTPRPNVIEIWDRDVESISEAVVQFHSNYEKGVLNLEIFIAAGWNADNVFILTGNSGSFHTIANFTKYLDLGVFNSFLVSYDEEYNDVELTVNDVVVEAGKFDQNADYINGFRIRTSLAETLLMWIDIISMS